MLLERVCATIDRYAMLDRGETVLVAVSGGVDSVVLLDLLQHVASDYAAVLHVAHLDHGLRGAASAGDARFVERLAKERGLPWHVSRLDAEALAAHRGHGAEGAARAARYAFFRRTAAEIRAEKIALGHTADDQAETVLHRLARGTGIAGLRGIPPVRLPFVRPLIDVTRGELLAHARENGLSWREDASNADLAFARNRIRHRVLPELEAINPKAVEAIGRASVHAAEAEEAARFLVDTIWPSTCAEEREKELAFRRSALTSYPGAVQRLLVREGASRVRGGLSGIDHDHVESVLRLAASDAAHGELSLPGLEVRAQADEIRLAPPQAGSLRPWAFPVDLGESVVPDPSITLHLSIDERPSPSLDPADRWSELADADRIEFPLVVRSRRDGDRFTPFGLGRQVKLKDFLINERIPYFDRDRLALLCDREKIVWVVGVRLSDDVRITAATRRVLRMKARRRT